MVGIVEGIQKIAVERVDVCEAREAVNCRGQALGESLGRVFDLAGVESSDSADLEACANLCGKSPLSAHS